MFTRRQIFCSSIFFSFFNLSLAQKPRLMVPIGHVGGVSSASFSPDGKYVLTSSFDKEAKVWNAASGRRVLDIKGHETQVNCASYSPDGKYIATASEDNTAKVWNAATGKLVADLRGHINYVYQATFSPDGKYILTCASRSSLARVWNALTGKVVVTLNHANSRGPSYQLYGAAFSPDGKYIVTASEEGTAKVWNTVSGKLLITLGDQTSKNWHAEFSPACPDDPSGGRFIVTMGSTTAKLWNSKNGKLIMQFSGHSGEIASVVFSPNGKLLLTASHDSTARIWNTITGKLLLQLSGHTNTVNSAVFSHDGKYIVTASNDHTAKVWDTDSGKLLKDLKGHLGEVITASFSNDGKFILTASNDGTARVWNAVNGLLLSTMEGHTREVKTVSFSPDGKYMVTATDEGKAKLWNALTGQIITTLQGHTSEITQVQFSPDGKTFVTSSYDSTARVWNTADGKLVTILHEDSCDIRAASFSPDGKYIISSLSETTAAIWDAVTGRHLATLKGLKSGLFSASFSPVCQTDSSGGKYILTAGPDSVIIRDAATDGYVNSLKGEVGYVSGAWYSPDGKYILTAASNLNSVKVWNAQTGQKLKTDLEDSTIYTSNLSFSPDGKYVIIIPEYGSIANVFYTDSWKLKRQIILSEKKISGIDFANKHITGIYNSEVGIYDLNSNKKLYTVIALDSTDYIVLLPSGYYQSTINASKLLHYVTKDLKVISFEQLDVKYNRPDLVLEAIGNPDTNLISTYRNAYYKRIKKLGIDTSSFRDGYSVPEADFADREKIPLEQKNEMLSLRIKGRDNTYPLDRFNVWINEVPVFGQRGISLRASNANNVDKIINIKLSQGVNRIETSVTNVNGTESYRMPLVVNYSPSVMQKETIYFIGIGIDRFANADYNLNYSTKDIRDLSAKLKEKFADKLVIDTLFNENVTAGKIKALKQRLQQTTVNDKVIISYSGHGLLSKDYDYYLSTYSVNFKKPEENGLAYDELESLLDSIPARKKLMLIDACNSGEVDKEAFQQVVINKAALDSNNIVSKGVIVTSTGDGSKKLGLKNSFELMQNIFVNVGKSTGATIISAAAGTEFALEKGDLKNGVFTYCVMEAMNKYPTMKISELKKIVGARVVELTKGMQKPTSRNEAVAVDWNVW